MNKPKTKAELIDILLERGHHRPALNKMKRDDLANLAEDAESHDVLAEEAAAPVATGDLTLPIEEVQVGDVWGGTKVAAVQFGPRWCYLQSKQGVWFLRVVAGQKVTITR